MKTVLVVDDEPGITNYVELSLTDAGYAVLKADCASQALEIFSDKSHRIDLVLSDIIMPGEMDGMMMIRAMRAINPVVKLLFMTGRVRGLPEDLTDTCGQVPKPFSSAQIVKAVHQCIDLDAEHF
jgi:DNA-binding NtrC family response regulator